MEKQIINVQCVAEVFVVAERAVFSRYFGGVHICIVILFVPFIVVEAVHGSDVERLHG